MARYCSCNGVSARCIRCACVRSKQPCVSCLPGRAGRCWNRLVLVRDGSSTFISQHQKSSTSLESDAECTQVDARGLALASCGLSPHVSSVSSQDSDAGLHVFSWFWFGPAVCSHWMSYSKPYKSRPPGFAHPQLSPFNSCYGVCQDPHPSPCS